MTFSSCDNADAIGINDCTYSKESEFSLNHIRHLGTREELKIAFAEDVLAKSLKKFRGNFGFSGIQYRHKSSGFKPDNPYNQKVWEVLLKRSAVERHTISNVDEGGLNLRDEKELRREISSFLDNGILGPQLKGFISDITE